MFRHFSSNVSKLAEGTSEFFIRSGGAFEFFPYLIGRRVAGYRTVPEQSNSSSEYSPDKHGKLGRSFPQQSSRKQKAEQSKDKRKISDGSVPVKTVKAPGFTETGQGKIKGGTKLRVRVLSEESQPKNAYEVVAKMRHCAQELQVDEEPDILEDPFERSEKVKTKKPFYPSSSPAAQLKGGSSRDIFDSKGYKTYRQLVPDYDQVTAEDIISMLKNRIIYNEHDIVAIDKPYGLPVHGGPGIHHNLARYLPDLAHVLVKDGTLPTLYLVNRIDKETTGVVLLSRTAETAAKLHDMFLNHTVKKIYWALTIGCPDPIEGVIDIPIGDSSVTGINRRVLRPVRNEITRLILKKTSDDGKRAVTNYCVLGSHGSCSLIELSPRTGVKHQVRLHLAYGMNCPILGDHKYSHFTKLAPQRLPTDILLRLKMRQAKVRTLPVFLHSKTLILPEYNEFGNIVISADLPGHFKHIMAVLKIKLGEFDTYTR